MRFVNSRLVQTALVANQKGVFQVPPSLLCDIFGLANCLEVFFVDVLAGWQFISQTSIMHLAFMDVHELWEAMVPNYSSEVLEIGHQYKHIVTSRLELAICVEDLRVSIVESAVAAWKQLQLGRIFEDMARYAPLDEFGSIPHATQFYLPTAFAIPPVLTLRYFSEAVHDREGGFGGHTNRHHFCTAAQMEIALHV